jgi:hypothetical protein
MQQRRHVAVAVARTVLDLRTDLPERAAFPRDRERSEMPFGMAGHMAMETWDLRRQPIAS